MYFPLLATFLIFHQVTFAFEVTRRNKEVSYERNGKHFDWQSGDGVKLTAENAEAFQQ